MKKGSGQLKVAAGANRDTMRAEYDFSGAQRGVHFKRYREGTNLVPLDADVLALFPTAREVNDALRVLGALAKHAKPTRRKHAA